MKTTLFGIALAALSSVAMAADLPVRTEAPAPAPVFVAANNWTGFYVGIVGGYSWSSVTHCDGGSNPACGGGGSVFPSYNHNGASFGGTLGYNHQIGSTVLGLEGDLSWANWRGSSGSNGAFGCGGGNTDRCASAIDWFATVRARLGYSMGNTLPYLTAGLAIDRLGASIVARSFTRTDRAHFVVGGGIEHAFTRNWSAKIEYLHIFSNGDFQYDTTQECGNPGCFLRSKDISMVRVGLNYRFGGSAAPVVAKY